MECKSDLDLGAEYIHTISASLFDMDGTLVDSTPGVVGAWNNLRKRYPHLDVQDILSCEVLSSNKGKQRLIVSQLIASHGIRTIENLRQHLGIEDPEVLEVIQPPQSL